MERNRLRRGPWLLGAALTALSGCVAPSPTKTITLAALEAAPPTAAVAVHRVLVTDPTPLRSLCSPLGPRLALIQVRSEQEWKRLARVAPGIGPQPDFSAGAILGIVSWAGAPLDGVWPVELEAIKVHDGGGLLKANFRSGSYLPDGSARLVTTYVPALQAVLVVELNGTAFYPNTD